MSNFFKISENDIKGLEGKVVIITGASSGIGLATTNLFLSKGAHVIGADLQLPKEPIQSSKFTFHKTDVTSWADLTALFSETAKVHNKIDIVFANAGISGKAKYLELEQDDSGQLIEPNRLTMEINLIAVQNTVALGIHYMKKQDGGGSIIMTASAAGYQRFPIGDYTAAKHGVVGFLRALRDVLHPKLPIRINAIAPSWTDTNILSIPIPIFSSLGIKVQPASAVALSVALLATDPARHGQTLYSNDSSFKEIEDEIMSSTLQTVEYESRENETEQFEQLVKKVKVEMAKKNAGGV